MSEAIPLTSRQTRALDRIARCPSCGAWVMWRDGADWLTAELDPSACHHEIRNDTRHERGHAA